MSFQCGCNIEMLVVTEAALISEAGRPANAIVIDKALGSAQYEMCKDLWLESLS